MKILLIIFINLLTCIIYGQTYTSPLTQHFPSSEIETINRVISFEPETITITSGTPRGEDVQVFTILQKEDRIIDSIGTSTVYTCTSLDGRFTTYLILPKVETPEFIDAIQPKQLNHIEKHFRFLLDGKGKDTISQ